MLDLECFGACLVLTPHLLLFLACLPVLLSLVQRAQNLLSSPHRQVALMYVLHNLLLQTLLLLLLLLLLRLLHTLLNVEMVLLLLLWLLLLKLMQWRSRGLWLHSKHIDLLVCHSV